MDNLETIAERQRVNPERRLNLMLGTLAIGAGLAASYFAVQNLHQYFSDGKILNGVGGAMLGLYGLSVLAIGAVNLRTLWRGKKQ